MSINQKGKPVQQWSFVSDTPIFQVLNINKFTNEVKGIPMNLYMEKEKNSVKLVFLGNYIYADHAYTYLPEYKASRALSF
jgi:hypothetical protein